MKILKLILIAIAYMILNNSMIYNCNNNPYFKLHKNYNRAYHEYNEKKHAKAKKSFFEIIKIDTNNFYWESYYYLSQIYLNESKIDSAILILEKGLQKGSPNWNAKPLYKVAIYGIKNDIKIDIEKPNSYHHLHSKVEPHLKYHSRLHLVPDIVPELKIGNDQFDHDIKNIIKSNSNRFPNKMAFIFIVDKHGRVGRVDFAEDKLEDYVVEKLYQYIFNLNWKPAIFRKKPMSFCFGDMVYLRR
jgi:tetratricopeptide (TPR) repeat protein